MRLQTPHDPTYATCAYTHAWLRIMSPDFDPEEITRVLRVTPTSTQIKGDIVPTKPDKRYIKAGWFLSTEGILQSKDSRDHLDWILDRVRDRGPAFQILHAHSYLIDVCVRWDSVKGDGGPTLSPKQMRELAALDIELWFDIYFR